MKITNTAHEIMVKCLHVLYEINKYSAIGVTGLMLRHYYLQI